MGTHWKRSNAFEVRESTEAELAADQMRDRIHGKERHCGECTSWTSDHELWCHNHQYIEDAPNVRSSANGNEICDDFEAP